MSEDTYKGKAEDPPSLNLYTYCHNNPIMFVDFTGNDPIPTWAQNINFGKGTEADYRKAIEIYENGHASAWAGSACIAVENAINKAIEHKSASTSTSNNGLYGDALYGNVTGPNLERGLTLGEVEVGIGKIGGEHKHVDWEVGTVTADAKAGVSLDYIGAQAGARLVEGEAGVKIPLPYTDKSLYLGVGGELFAIGLKGYYDINEGRLKIGAALLIGASISIGLED